MEPVRGRGLFVVGMDVPAEYEAEFNRWYDGEHLPARRALAGTLSARRFLSVDGSPRYLTLYELESPEVIGSEAFRSYRPSENDLRMQRIYEMSMRAVYREITADE